MTNNNGNLKKQDVYIPQSESATISTMWTNEFAYDKLNRLNWVREFNSTGTQLWKQEYAYDRFGNRSINASGTTQGVGINSMQAAVVPNTLTNRLYAPVRRS